MDNSLSISLNDIYRMLMPLSSSNKRWLGNKLIAEAESEDHKSATNGLVYPHISKGHVISKEAMDMVIGSLPEGFDIDKATDEMWEEFAK